MDITTQLMAYYGPLCQCGIRPTASYEPDAFDQAYASFNIEALGQQAIDAYIAGTATIEAPYAALTAAQVNLVWSRVQQELPERWQQADNVANSLYNQLRQNTEQFFFLKNRSMAQQIVPLLTDTVGNVRRESEVYALARPIVQDYNRLWFKAEYNAHTASAQMTSKWETLRNAPLITFRTAGDERVRQTHRPLDGITLPPTDPFWLSFYPPLAWNCRCTVSRASFGAQVKSAPADLSPDIVPPVFQNHPAFTGQLVNVSASPYATS